MHYYIDGYNLMFRILGADDELQEQRTRFIQEISKKIDFVGIDATLVFDAHYNPEDAEFHHLHNIEIKYTDFQVSADDMIIGELSGQKNPRGHTVVTSDKKLAWRARRRSAKTMTVEEFYSLLEKRVRNKNREKKGKPPAGKLPRKLIDPKTLPVDQDAYYLQEFEKRLHKQGDKKSKEDKKKEGPQNEVERWQQLFEERMRKPPEDVF